MTRTRFETAEAFTVAQALSIDFAGEPFTWEDFREGLDVELTHCEEHPGLSGEDFEALGRIVLEHLRTESLYYRRLLEGSTT